MPFFNNLALIIIMMKNCGLTGLCVINIRTTRNLTESVFFWYISGLFKHYVVTPHYLIKNLKLLGYLSIHANTKGRII